MQLTKKTIIICSVIGLLLLGVFVFVPSSAQAGLWENLTGHLANGEFVMDDLQILAINIINLALFFITWITMIIMIIGGYFYITASGNPDLLERGKKTITGAVVAFILIIISKAIIVYLEGYLKQYVGQFNLVNALQSVINLMLFPIGLIAVLGLITGGYQYIMAAGNPELLERAKKTILYSVIGLIAIIASWAILYFIAQSLGVANYIRR